MTSAAEPWPGRGLGLPATGPRSVGRLGRRLAALAIDYAYTIPLSIAFFDYSPLSVTLIFATAQIVSLVLLNGSPGHLVMGLRVVPVRGGLLGVWRPALRTLLLVLVIPAVIWDADQRGMHDRLSGTVLVRR